MIKTEVMIESYPRMDRLRAAQISQMAARFESRLTFESEGMILNAKSMLGLLSHTMTHGMTLVADGCDEQAATDAIVPLLRARTD